MVVFKSCGKFPEATLFVMYFVFLPGLLMFDVDCFVVWMVVTFPFSVISVDP
jgi:hypothetical protein